MPSIHAGPTPRDVWADNTRAGSVVLQTAADLKLPRVIYTSTCQVYGMWEGASPAVPQRLPFDETHPLAPGNAYAMWKARMKDTRRCWPNVRGCRWRCFGFRG